MRILTQSKLLLLELIRLELDQLLQQIRSTQEWVTQFHSAVLQIKVVYAQVDGFEWAMLAQDLEDAEAVVNDEHNHELVPSLTINYASITFTYDKDTYNRLRQMLV